MNGLRRGLIGWDIGLAIYLALTFAMMWRADVEHIRKRAAEQDEGALAILLLSIVATFASLVAIVFALGGSKQSGAAVSAVCWRSPPFCCPGPSCTRSSRSTTRMNIMASAATARSADWNSPGDKKPDYRDFLYFSLVIGMTSQVSDVPITSKVIRRMVAMHGVLSFFFNLVVLALTVNMVADLI